jgi:predicted phosphodiesterase
MQVIRRVGLIGDLHAEHLALSWVLEQFAALGVDSLLQVGDIADGPGDLNATCAVLREHRVQAVRGNHDRWLLNNQQRDVPDATPLSSVTAETLAFLSALPTLREYRSPRGNVLLCHGLGGNDLVGVKPDDEGYALSTNAELQALIANRRYRYVLNGHTHRAMLRTFGPLSVVNAGTLFRNYERCFTLIDFERGELERFLLPPGELCRELSSWRRERQVLADSPSEPFR